MKVGYEIVENVGAMLKDVPNLTFTYVRQELRRFANRFKKRLARERMSGPPGINWYHSKTLKGSRHLKYKVEGDSLKKLAMVSRISGVLMMHETGGTIRPRKGDWLYIQDRQVKYGNRQPKWHATMGKSALYGITARVKSITLRPRLGFRMTFYNMVPEERQRLHAAMGRALTVARERNIKPVKIMMKVGIG